jgi:hypothetical protein
MRLKKGIMTTMIALIFAYSAINPVSAFNQGMIPSISVFPCSGDYKIITKTGDNLSVLNKRLPKFATPGSTLMVTQSYATTISNSVVVTLIPEFLSMGYEISITAGTDIGWSKTNTTNTLLQLVILGIYDTFSVKQYYEVTPGSCAFESLKTYQVYEGDAFDLIP